MTLRTKNAARKTSRYAAFLRGVSQVNAKMPALKAAFESAGFSDVVTVLSSGNVVFSARPESENALERQAEAAMQAALGRTFYTIVRSVDDLQRLLKTDVWNSAPMPKQAKQVVSFFRKAPPKSQLEGLPIARDGAQLWAVRRSEAFSFYTPSPLGPVFMSLIRQQFGDEVTTRTWQTVMKVSVK